MLHYKINSVRKCKREISIAMFLQIKPNIYREKNVYIKTHKTAIKSARAPHGRDVTHILSKVSCFLLKPIHFRRLQKR